VLVTKQLLAKSVVWDRFNYAFKLCQEVNALSGFVGITSIRSRNCGYKLKLTTLICSLVGVSHEI